MQLEKTSHWLMIIGNFGLFIGVVLVVFQINQNSELTREQLNYSIWTDRMNVQLAMMGENPAAAVAKALEAPSEITVEESKVLDAVYTHWALLEVRTVMMQERGMTINEEVATYDPDAPRMSLHIPVLGNEYFKARFAVHGMGPDLSPKVQPLMDSLSGNESLMLYEKIMAHIKQSTQQ